MRVAAIFINYRTAELTLKSVSALVEQLDAITSHHVYVVDNDSRDGSFEVLSRGFKERGLTDRVTVLASGRNGGYGAGINFAVKHVLGKGEQPDYFFVLNTDAFARPGSFEKLLGFMDEHPRVGLAGSCICGIDGQGGVSGFRYPSIEGELEASAHIGFISKLFSNKAVAILPVPEVDTEVDWVPGTSMLIRRAVFEGGVYFDEDFFLYFEEIDFARQVSLGGWQVYAVADAPINHEGYASTGLSDEHKPWPDYWFDSRRRYFTKYHGAKYALAADVARAIGTGVYFAKCVVGRKRFDERPAMVGGMLRANLRRLSPGKSS